MPTAGSGLSWDGLFHKVSLDVPVRLQDRMDFCAAHELTIGTARQDHCAARKPLAKRNPQSHWLELKCWRTGRDCPAQTP